MQPNQTHYQVRWWPNNAYIRRYWNCFAIGTTRVFIGYKNKIGKERTGYYDEGNSVAIRSFKPGVRYKIHFFIGTDSTLLRDEQFISDLKWMVENLHPQAMILIHIPYRFKFLKEMFEEKFEFDKKKVQVLPERIFPKFVISSHYSYVHSTVLNIEYDRNLNCIRARVEFPFDCGDIGCMYYDESAPVQNDLQMRNPEKYKDEIISRFKATTPLGILKSFKDEDAIWDFIMVKGEWEPQVKKPKKSINLNAKDLGTTNVDDLKTIMKDMMAKAADELAKEYESKNNEE